MIQISRDPQTGLTTIVLDDAALDMLDDVLSEFDEQDIYRDSLTTAEQKRAAFVEMRTKVNDSLPYL